MPISIKARHILELNRDEKRVFLDSFDIVLSDCDGVIWLSTSFIAKAGEAIQLLINAGKKYKFISNNSVRSDKEYDEKFTKLGISSVSAEIDVVHPIKTVKAYLKSQGYKKVFPIASEQFNADLVESGYEIVELPKDKLWTTETFTMEVRPTDIVDAVIVDIDMNGNHAKLCRAHQYLLNPNCEFIVGASDKFLPLRENFKAMGTEGIIKALTEASGKEPLVLGKPGAKLGEYLIKQYDIVIPKRALFIGDALVQDIQFGNACGFQTLFVLSGACTKEQMLAEPDDLKPDYYADSMADFVKFFDEL